MNLYLHHFFGFWDQGNGPLVANWGGKPRSTAKATCCRIDQLGQIRTGQRAEQVANIEEDSDMDLNRYTEKAQQGFQAAQRLALRFGHQQMEPEHLLLAL